VTTISTNIFTEGTVTMESASTTQDFWLGNLDSEDDDYLYMDASSTEYLMWDNGNDQFVFSNGLSIPSGTTTDSFGVTGIASSTGGFRVNDTFVIDFLGVASTTKNFSVGDGSANATTTIEIGDITNTSAGCLKILDADEDAYTYCYTDAGTMICDTADNCLK